MAWSYDPTDLTTDTVSGRLNSVRFLIGDNDTNDQQLQDEEIQFALAQSGDNIYSAGAWSSRALANKFARLVNIDLDGQLAAEYSDLTSQYLQLADSLEYQAKKVSGALGMVAGGISKTDMRLARQAPDRVKPSFRRNQFDNPPDDGDYNYDYWD